MLCELREKFGDYGEEMNGGDLESNWHNYGKGTKKIGDKAIICNVKLKEKKWYSNSKLKKKIQERE